MHELSIVETLIEQVQQEVERAGHHGRVLRLDLTIGRLSGACCDSIRFAFELLAPDTPLADAELHITEPKATCRCQDCRAVVEIDQFPVGCPRCGSRAILIDGGRELLLQSIEIED
ncbi:MAG TPA: hydrogenase maturation nickel metallochaperone HypA [Thermoguttaceae bacterium]|nr:hydrogenase maturation nickel metallochaperone HypA [Thermoguttaceae bacterium]